MDSILGTILAQATSLFSTKVLAILLASSRPEAVIYANTQPSFTVSTEFCFISCAPLPILLFEAPNSQNEWHFYGNAPRPAVGFLSAFKKLGGGGSVQPIV